MSDELHSLFTQAVNKSRDRAYRKGLVGRHNVDTTVSYAVTGRADFLYVTLDNKTVITAINQAGVPQTEDYPVLLRKNLLGQWVIVDRDVSSSLGAPTAIPPSGVVAHATSHQHGGSDEVATATPGANAIVKADADGKIGAGWIDDIDINLDNVTEGTTNKFFDATEQTKLAGIEAGADVTDAGNIASSITGVSTDDTIVDADVWGYLTGGALVKTAWSNIKAVLKTYFDTLYNLYVHPNHTGDVTSVADGATTIAADAVTNAKAANMAADTIKGRANGAGTGDPTDLTATQVRTIINVASGADVTGAAITALATKTTPVDADAVVITDSAASDAPKRTTWTNIKATLKTYLDTLYVALTGAQTIAGVKDFTDGIKLAAGTILNVYQEGTWTPVLRFGGATTGITYTTQTGYYTRIGNRVFIHCLIVLSSKGSATGNADISGLPFTVGNSSPYPARWLTMVTSFIGMFIIPSAGGTTAAIRALTAASTDGGVAITDTAFNNTSQLNFEANYRI